MADTAKKEFLGNLVKTDPHRFAGKGERPVENLFLALALVYNDLKGLIMLMRLVQQTYRVPSSEVIEVSVHAGEYAGIRMQIIRILISVTHEFLELLRANKEVFEQQDYKNVIAQVRHPEREEWEEIVEIALGTHSDAGASDFKSFLASCRNKVGFHYDESVIRASFEAKFFAGIQREDSLQAMYSLENDMENTRFYFADAAAQEGVSVLAKRTARSNDSSVSHVALEKQEEFIGAMNRTLWHVMRAYIMSRPH